MKQDVEGTRSAGGWRGTSLLLMVRRKAADVYYGLKFAGIAIRLRNWPSAVPNVRGMLDRPGAGGRSRFGFYRTMQRMTRTAPGLRITRCLFGAVAEPYGIIRVRPGDVTHAMTYDFNLYVGEVLPGDWDRRTIDLDELPRYRSILQHYEHDVPWEETDFFREPARRFERGAGVENTHDVYEDMKADGFRVRSIPHVHIARDGRILLGNEGLQRLAIARVLGIRQIPCHVRVRHLAWQRIRERVARSGAGTVAEAVAGHPDLADLVGSDPGAPDAVDLYGMADRLPSMGGARIGPLLRQLARSASAGTSIVEVGSWLGAGTAQLALGVRERRDPGDVTVHCYDLWSADRSERVKASMFGLRLARRENTLPRVRRSLAPFGVPVTFHRGDILRCGWDGGPISVYVDDVSKSPPLFAHALRTFGPSWVPGETVLVLMDYVHWKKSGIPGHKCQKHLIEANGECFERLDWPFATGVFLYRKRIDFSAMPIGFASTGLWE